MIPTTFEIPEGYFQLAIGAEKMPGDLFLNRVCNPKIGEWAWCEVSIPGTDWARYAESGKVIIRKLITLEGQGGEALGRADKPVCESCHGYLSIRDGYWVCWNENGCSRCNQRIRPAPAPKTPEAADHCTWTEDENGPWETSCGHHFTWEDDGPTENGAKFCLYCGKPLVEKLFVLDEEEGGERNSHEPA